ncbi:glycosyltransferase involved in cell wall biosynthesis [Breznakibacter xylanolyticus]|uniref:Glycosyltransferase involved in cell wall biosynthesis n=2 Tax=Breznakibacter xylanolyticus TaxID=990 RepID=A0A2W7NT08_9BACT|nr:glycosyltransferase involved in cell wall biosynthesis [Breznakibacter xylanolyticus]
MITHTNQNRAIKINPSRHGFIMKKQLFSYSISPTQSPDFHLPLVRICLTGDMNTDYRVHKTAMSLMSMGYRVECVTAQCKAVRLPSSKPYSIKVLRLMFRNGPLFYAEFNLRLWWYLIYNPSHTVLSIDLDTLTGCRMAKWLGRFRLVFDSHEYFPEVPELQHRPVVKKVWQWLERHTIGGVDRAYTVCGSIADIYQKKYGVPFQVVRNLPELKSMTHVQPAIVDSRFKLVYQGAINKGRGIVETIRALAYLDNVLLVIVGSGDETELVQREVERVGVQHKVLMTGRIPFDELPAYTLSADVGLCLLENIGLNYYYSLPNRIFDFAQAGIPVLASNFPEIRKVVGDMGTGLLLDDLNPETIARAIEQLRGDKVAYQMMCDNAIKASRELVWECDLPVLRNVFNR